MGFGKDWGLDFGVGFEKYLQRQKKISKRISAAKKIRYPNNLLNVDSVNCPCDFLME